MFCTLSYDALHLYEVSWKYHETVSELRSGHEYMVEMAMFNVQKAITLNEAIQSYGSCVLHIV